MRWWVVALVVSAGCGPSTIGDLARPALIVVVREPGGFCASTYAVDAAGQTWLETGCASSSGLRAQGHAVSAGERSELDALMDRVLALPDDPGCEVPSPSARQLRFVRTGPEPWSETRQCEPGLPADASALLERMARLVDPGAPAGDGG